MLLASPSKSHTMRALFFALIARGKSKITNYLDSPDTDRMIDAVRALGGSVDKHLDYIDVKGVGGKLISTKQIINAGNSGLVFRLMTGLSALMDSYTVITGDESICHRRPIKALLNALESAKAFAKSSLNDDHAPVIIRGPIKAGEYEIEGRDSQPVSSFLMVLSLLSEKSTVRVINPGEEKWLEVTFYWLNKLGLNIEMHGNHTYRVGGLQGTLESFNATIPGDYSSATYPMAYAFLKHKKIEISGLERKDTQPDREFIDILALMGADVEFSKSKFLFSGVKSFDGIERDVGNCIDCLPLLALICCFAETPSRIYGGSIARNKESDRIFAITKELRKMGARIEEKEDGMIIYPSLLQPASVKSYEDHRIAMTLTIALRLAGGGDIDSMKMVNKSYKNFTKDLDESNFIRI